MFSLLIPLAYLTDGSQRLPPPPPPLFLFFSSEPEVFETQLKSNMKSETQPAGQVHEDR